MLDAKTVDALVEDFDLFDDWEDRYRYLIDLGDKLPPMAAADKSDETKVRGCMSQVWFVHRIEAGPDGPRIHYTADSDAHIVKGLIALLLMLYSGRTPQEIKDLDIEAAFRRLDLEEHISPNRRNGFFAMVGRIRSAADGL